MHYSLKYLFGAIICLFCGLPLHAQTSGTKVPEIQVNSKALKKNIRLHIYLPDGYYQSNRRYATIYYISGNQKSEEEIAVLSRTPYRPKNLPEFIMVGINDSDGLTDRMKDTEVFNLFLSAIEKEIIPAVEKGYRVNGKRVLHDKSLFGSFTLYAAFTRPALFHGYIAASKQWYEESNEYFTELARKAMQNPKALKGRSIFLATLNGAYNNNNIPEVNENMAALVEMLTAKSKNRISAKHLSFDDWGLSMHPWYTQGIEYILSPRGKDKDKTNQLSMVQTSQGKWVIQNSKKRTLYEVFHYDNGPDYPSEGLIRVVKNGKIGYANASTYEIIIEPQFDCAFPFENGLAKVSKQCKTIQEGEYQIWQSDSWLYIDKIGHFSH